MVSFCHFSEYEKSEIYAMWVFDFEIVTMKKMLRCQFYCDYVIMTQFVATLPLEAFQRDVICFYGHRD